MTAIELTSEIFVPQPPTPSGYTWRPVRREDLPSVHAMLLAADQADDRQNAGSLADLEREFEDPWSNAETDSVVALAPDGTVAAMGRVIANPQPEGEARAYLWEEIHPAHRHVAELSEYVLDWLEARGAHRLAAAPREMPRIMRGSCPDNQRERTLRYERHGFRPVRYFYRMRRDLSEPIPDRPLPEGLSLRTYSRELDGEAMDAFNESFSDHWGFERVSAKDWQMFFVERSSFRPDLTFLAVEAGAGGTGRIAGFSMNRVSAEENARYGMRAGKVGQVGVRRAWRKRGVASALVCHSMRAFKAEGLDTASLGVDAENLTGALGLYERLGFVVVKRFVTFEKRKEMA